MRKFFPVGLMLSVMLFASPALALPLPSTVLETQGIRSEIFLISFGQELTPGLHDTLSFNLRLERLGDDPFLPSAEHGLPDGFTVSFLGSDLSETALYHIGASSQLFDNRLSLDLASLHGLSGTLYFDLLDNDDGFFTRASLSDIQVAASSVPEPSTLILFSCAAFSAAALRKRFRKKSLS